MALRGGLAEGVARGVGGVILAGDHRHGGVVVVDDGLLGDSGVAHGHTKAAVTEQLHDRDQGEAGVEQLGGIGVPVMPRAA